jgi:hypothetical protein
MQSGALVLAIAVTALYGYGAQATMAADLARVRAAVVELDRPGMVWDGGILPPIIVEAAAATTTVVTGAPACEAPGRRG